MWDVLNEVHADDIRRHRDAAKEFKQFASSESAQFRSGYSRCVGWVLESTITADEVAQTLGVSRRVLNYAFQDTLGISPYQYVFTERLHAVRRMLKTSDASVNEAILVYGFSTRSPFARQYDRLFGELPSQTKQEIAPCQSSTENFQTVTSPIKRFGKRATRRETTDSGNSFPPSQSRLRRWFCRASLHGH